MNLSVTGIVYGFLFVIAYIFLPFFQAHLSPDPLHRYAFWYLYDTLSYPLLSIFVLSILGVLSLVHGSTQWKAVTSGIYENLTLTFHERYLVLVILVLSSVGVSFLLVTFPKAICYFVHNLFGSTPVSVKASAIQDQINAIKKRQKVLKTEEAFNHLTMDEKVESTQNDEKIEKLKVDFRNVMKTRKRQEFLQTLGILLGVLLSLATVSLAVCLTVESVVIGKKSVCGALCGFYVNERGILDDVIKMFGVFSPVILTLLWLIVAFFHVVGVFCKVEDTGRVKLQLLTLRKREYHLWVKMFMCMLIGFGGISLLIHVISPNVYLNTEVNIFIIGKLHFPLFGLFVSILRWVLLFDLFGSVVYAFLYYKSTEEATTMDDQVIPFYLR
ncbi:hypothetical protein EIN_055890 [Entamoeba invadens IP1]|uniref:hypothetical protein n=1 Tax=Entamoeba invadens IP1 TaxID=370355 RepID=UPI0002C3D7E0|nr:hypothetical protein EIN_055890 [Entamoeba invadens IP1]ELP93234.1 hypothetical protein EIN_055890 [Entamoeba invadens IP1]|eukprot:XP_004260005.1 hypothetical protein EIN_055890 [Entamoeba invadens IP1]